MRCVVVRVMQPEGSLSCGDLGDGATVDSSIDSRMHHAMMLH